jgi:predicted transglutaminase-like cysteine proteinase
MKKIFIFASALSAFTIASPAMTTGLSSSHPLLSAPAAASGPDVFGTVALPVRHSRYDARWHRVADSPRIALPDFAQPAQSLSGDQQAQTINAAMNRHVHYRYDFPRDNWATANETMSKLAGDCEDIAIAKMQTLLTLGVPASDLFMSIGSDTAAGAVHAVLMVRLDGRFWVLDNRSDRLIPHEAFNQFHPILTFSGERTWLHGYRVGTMPAEVRALSVAAQTGRLQVGGAGSSPAAARS